jgi:hypothetical protein
MNVFVLLPLLLLQPRPVTDWIAHAWQVEAEHELRAHWARHFGAATESFLFCSDESPPDVWMGEVGRVTCSVWPTGPHAGAVIIPYVCCPPFYPCREASLVATGGCTVRPIQKPESP